MAGWGFNTGLDGHRITPLSEEEAEQIAGGLAETYYEARLKMLDAVAKRVSRGVTQFGWAEQKANEVLTAHAQFEQLIERVGKERESILGNVIDRAMMSGNQKFYSDMQRMIGAAGVSHISPNSIKSAYILADLNNSLNAAERRILRQFDDKYADVIGRTSSLMATGTITAKQAVGEALRDFADSGVDTFIDRGGHYWTLWNYSEMATLTAIERATVAGYVDTMQSYGYDLAIIDSHAGSCPLCEAWEDVIVSVSGDNHNYPSLDEAESAGCFHPRCLHGLTTYYEGVSEPAGDHFKYEPDPVREESREYSTRSYQRYCERQIRKYKERLIVAQTTQQKSQARNKVQEWEDRLDGLIEAQPASNYLYRQSYREHNH